MLNIKHSQQQCKDYGYKEVKAYLNEELCKEEMIEKIKKETRHYAKRQLTWFRKNKETLWLNAQEKVEQNIAQIEKYI